MATAILRKSSHIRQVLLRIQEKALPGIVPSKDIALGIVESKRQAHLLYPLLSRYRFLNSSSEGSSGEGQTSSDERRQSINRLLYRSRQRGYLELDLILGKWTEENIERLDEQKLKSLVEVLEMENPELWKWLTGQEVMPQHLTENPVLMEIHHKIMGELKEHSPSETRAKLGQPWVRGWDDNRRIGGPQVGNQ